jgi:CRISPR-associated protein Csm4
VAQRDSVWLYRLTPLSPFHLGEKGAYKEAVRIVQNSASLFGALCFGFLELVGPEELRKILERFKEGDPPFLLSSAFPFEGDVFYIEPPSGYRRDKEELERKVKVHLPGVQLRFMLEKPFSISVFSIPRVRVDRDAATSEFFVWGMARFGEEAGLWFLVDFLDEGIKKLFDAALEHLGEAGMGGGRAYGYGRFERESRHLETFEVKEEGYLGSLFLPKEDELDILELYDFLTHFGWIGTLGFQSFRAQPLRMIKEGAILKAQKPILGRMADVAPRVLDWKGPQVLRYGYAFLLPVRREEK